MTTINNKLKVFKVTYKTDDSDQYCSTVICESEDDVIGIIEERESCDASEIKISHIYEQNPEEVLLSKITIGDYRRLMISILNEVN